MRIPWEEYVLAGVASTCAGVITVQEGESPRAWKPGHFTEHIFGSGATRRDDSPELASVRAPTPGFDTKIPKNVMTPDQVAAAGNLNARRER